MDHDGSHLGQPHVLPTLLAKLQELLEIYQKFQPTVVLPLSEEDLCEVTFGMRDGSAHILRCLKVWYELPSDVFFCAINLMDRFLTKMKIQPKHMACISIASFHLACKMLCMRSRIPDPAHMIIISQCNCTLSDLLRMESVIANKLGINTQRDISVPITSLTFLRIFHQIFSIYDVNSVYKRSVNEFEIYQRLEVIACDGSCVNYKASEIALALLCSEMDIGVARLRPSPCACIDVLSVVTFISEIQQIADICDSDFYNCLESVLRVVGQYNSQAVMPHRQRLIWRLSQRTLRDLRPTNKLVSTLPTIDEQGQPRYKKLYFY